LFILIKIISKDHKSNGTRPQEVDEPINGKVLKHSGNCIPIYGMIRTGTYLPRAYHEDAKSPRKPCGSMRLFLNHPLDYLEDARLEQAKEPILPSSRMERSYPISIG
jgi:hypothetical protein